MVHQRILVTKEGNERILMYGKKNDQFLKVKRKDILIGSPISKLTQYRRQAKPSETPTASFRWPSFICIMYYSYVVVKLLPCILLSAKFMVESSILYINFSGFVHMTFPTITLGSCIFIIFHAVTLSWGGSSSRPCSQMKGTLRRTWPWTANFWGVVVLILRHPQTSKNNNWLITTSCWNSPRMKSVFLQSYITNHQSWWSKLHDTLKSLLETFPRLKGPKEC